jgi:hypothetical protein
MTVQPKIKEDPLKDRDLSLLLVISLSMISINLPSNPAKGSTLTSKTKLQDNVYGRVNDYVLIPLHMWFLNTCQLFRKNNLSSKKEKEKRESSFV